MQIMKSLLFLCCFLSITILAPAKNIDTIHIQSTDLNFKNLQTGSYSYVVFFKKTKESASTRILLVKINVESKLYHNKPAFVIKQQWDLDTIVHAAYSVFDGKTFATLVHDTYWKSLGYRMKYDFEAKTVEFTNVNLKTGIPDSVKSKSTAGFNDSFSKYNLNWHADLIIYQLLPYKDKRTFMINFYDPGFGKAEEVDYTVTGSELLTGHNGEKIDCWVLYHNDPANGYEKFWIAKKTNEVLKEEDSGARGYRYKLKIGISGDQ